MIFHPSRHRWCAFHDLLKPIYVAQPRAYYSCLVMLALAYSLEFATFTACDAPTEQQLRRAFLPFFPSFRGCLILLKERWCAPPQVALEELVLPHQCLIKPVHIAAGTV